MLRLRHFVAVSLLVADAAIGGVSMHTLRPTHNDTFSVAEDSLQRPWALGQGYAGAQLSQLSTPIGNLTAGGQELPPRFSRLYGLDLLAGYRAGERWTFGADLPVDLVQENNGPSRFALADLRLVAKYRVYRQGNWAFSVMPNAYAPTGNSSLSLSFDSFGVGLSGGAEWDAGPVRFVASVGILHFPEGRTASNDYRLNVPLSIGMQIPFTDKFWGSVEGTTQYLIDGGAWGSGDAYLGAGARIGDGLVLNAGAGLGRVQQSGTVSFRGIASLKVIPVSEAMRPVVAAAPREPAQEKAPSEPVPRSGTGPAASSAMSTSLVEPTSKLAGCGVRPFSAEFFARRLTSKEFNELKVLPYRSTKTTRVPTLQLGEMTGMTSTNLPYVRGSQIVFAVDMSDLPPRNAIVGVETLALKMALTKVSAKKETKEELLCFLDNKVCSGDWFRTGKYRGNVDPRFFGGKETPNDYFARQFLDRAVGGVGGVPVFAGDVTLDIDKLIENAPDISPLSVLYGNESASHPLAHRTLRIAVAGNTFVGSDVRLVMTLRENTCESAKYVMDER